MIPPFGDSCSDLVIVTGSDSSHFKSVLQFLASLHRHEPDIRVVVFDLGLESAERRKLQKDYPYADLRKFDYSKYPDYFNIKLNAGEYAWKPVILYDILMELGGCICWMDAGNYVTAPLFWLRRIVARSGLYSPCSSGRISDWTHPQTLQALNVSKSLLRRPNRAGGCVGVNYHHIKARELILTWKNCALDRECIAPQGSNRKNHRQDQAVLTVLIYQFGFHKKIPTGLYGFDFHRDIKKRSKNEKR